MTSFIILHYKNLKDTIECIESINKIDGDKSIIVVDNNSTTKKEQKIILKYTEDLILLKENMGFAKGNNEGCKYAIKKYHPDFLCVINNDIIIEQQDFCKKVINDYEKYEFDALGPKILTDGGDSVNPFKTYDTIIEINSEIKKCKRKIRIFSSKTLSIIYKFLSNIKHLIIRKQIKFENGKSMQFDVSLHGCAIIFSRKYYEKFDDVFYNNTFLYHEEEFLSLRRDKYKLNFMYDPYLEVFHKESASVNNEYKNNREKIVFRNNERLKSLILLKGMRCNDETKNN